jgi:hypothetical protein
MRIEEWKIIALQFEGFQRIIACRLPLTAYWGIIQQKT